MFGGIVKFGSIEERAAIVAQDGIFRGRLGSGAGGDNFVLKAAGKSDDSGLSFVGSEKNLAVFLIDCRDGGELGFLFLLHRAGEGGERGLGLFVGEKKFAAAESVLDAAGDDGGVQINAFLFHTFPDICADGVTGFFAIGFESLRRGWRTGLGGCGGAWLFGRGGGLRLSRGCAGRGWRLGGRSLG